MTDVRSKSSAPVLSDFSSSGGTPIVVNRATGSAFVLRDGERMADIKNGVIRVADYADGDGSIETAAVQAAMDAGAGGTVDFGERKDFMVDASLTPASNTRYVGGSRVFAAPNSISGAVFDCSNKSNVTFDYGLEIDANKANAGAHHGIFFYRGSNNRALNVYIHDTIEAGILGESETNLRISGCDVIDCGLNGYAENHGIELYSITALPLENCCIENCLIEGAYRKGVTVYSDGSGTILCVQVVNNRVNGCGLGGIFIANLTASNQKDIQVRGNKLDANYTNIVVADAINALVANNACRSSSGGEGITIQNVLESDIHDNIIVDSYSIGLNFVGTTNNYNNVHHNTVMRSNQGLAAYAPGLRIIGANNSIFDTNVIVGESSSPKQTHAIYEESDSDNNHILDNLVANCSSGTLVTTTGGSTVVRSIP